MADLLHGRHDETPLYYAATAPQEPGSVPTITVYNPDKLQVAPGEGYVYVARGGGPVNKARIAEFDISDWIET